MQSGHREGRKIMDCGVGNSCVDMASLDPSILIENKKQRFSKLLINANRKSKNG
jgi:hypothetical protein